MRRREILERTDTAIESGNPRAIEEAIEQEEKLLPVKPRPLIATAAGKAQFLKEAQRFANSSTPPSP